MRRVNFMIALMVVFMPLRFALAQAPGVTGEYDGVRYASGGIGLDSRHALRATERDYDLMVVLALKNGEYLGGGTVNVRDESGKTVLEVDAQGPWVFAQLSPGRYTVEAKAGDTSRRSAVAVGKKTLARVVLLWDKDPG
jgi:hypothetical protein